MLGNEENRLGGTRWEAEINEDAVAKMQNKDDRYRDTSNWG
jgi:hypothetical protein